MERAVKIAIVAGEPSGDRLGAGLIGALAERYPGATFQGTGGPLMAAAGCDVLYDMERIGVMGLDGLFGKLRDILAIRRDLLERFSRDKPDVFIGIDVPDFNLGLEERLRRTGVVCVHYVSPTVWAWRGYRIHRIRRSIDHMLCLFPFEADYYRRHDVPVTCVGHPMADEIEAPDRDRARDSLELSDGLVIALLPGSRRSEIRRLAPVIVEAAGHLQRQHPGVRFLLPFANAGVAEEFYRVAGPVDHLPLTALDGDARLALEACDLAILASGTAALEAALLQRPMVVVYRVSSFSYRLIRRLRHVDHYSMPNHLLPEPLVPELIQDRATAENIVAEVDRLLNDPHRIEALEDGFARVHQELKRDANRRACDAVVAAAGLAA